MAGTAPDQRTLLRDGLIVDGTGGAPRQGSVLLDGGRIAALGNVPKDAGAAVDCEGKVIAPGFIDAHSHMDFFSASENPHHFDSFTAQGVTTFVAGNCGFSPFGFAPNTKYRSLLEGSLFKAARETIDWDSFAEYRELLGSLGLTHNFVHLVGHGAARTSLSGFEARRLSEREHAQLLALLDGALAEGAAGVSFGLQYKPGVFAKLDELDDVARLVKRHDKLLTVHAKAYSSFSGTYPMIPFGRPHNLKAIDDMLGLARRTGVRLQFSHLIFVGSQTWKTVDEALELFDRAIADGVDVCFDMFPYGCGATLLNTLLPEWFMARMPGALHNPLARARLRLEAEVGFRLVGFGYPQIQITNASCPEYDDHNGRFVPDIAARVRKSSFDTMLDILDKSNAQARVLFHDYYNDEIIDRLMQHPAAIFATDSWPELGGHQNPAAYGTFPRFLRKARERGSLSLEAAVHKMTGAAATRFRLGGRGRLDEGAAADVVVFDWHDVRDSVNDTGNASPSGIEHVFVNGQAILQSGELNLRRGAGEVLLS
ncbi:MAG: amidohydrolase family protein [Myxococcales bacterium]|nr:amidohydrolase family protein [Deltaproteobacteria bacterium]NND28990.1 amidohydrolase family protein [Myxococcales bacterium]MBT8482796.1 amidohydrolase family protein [Deltaproteobacteria bacterium]NNK42105.1 amidohydrolase family protein [Myxococcales bacterium]NNL25657.1 amidohydrolase family protein [Myxococcales bacterium]